MEKLSNTPNPARSAGFLLALYTPLLWIYSFYYYFEFLIKITTMKQLVFLLLVVAIAACKPDPVSQLVADYEQTLFDTKVDFGFKMKEQKLIKEHTAQDSILIYEELKSDARQDRIDNLEEFITDMQSEIQTSEFPEVVEAYKVKVEEYRAEIDDYKSGAQENYLMKALQKEIDRLKQIENPLFGYIYECTYTVKNPFLNNATQEITNQYLINPDKTLILKKIDKEEN